MKWSISSHEILSKQKWWFPGFQPIFHSSLEVWTGIYDFEPAVWIWSNCGYKMFCTCRFRFRMRFVPVFPGLKCILYQSCAVKLEGKKGWQPKSRLLGYHGMAWPISHSTKFRLGWNIFYRLSRYKSDVDPTKEQSMIRLILFYTMTQTLFFSSKMQLHFFSDYFRSLALIILVKQSWHFCVLLSCCFWWNHILFYLIT